MRSDDEDTFDAQVVQEGSRSPADVFYTENSPALEYLQQRGLLAQGRPVDPREDAPAKFNPPQATGSVFSARVSVLVYNPSLHQEERPPEDGPAMAKPATRADGLRARRNGLPADRHGGPRAYGKQRTLAWLNGIKANAAGHVYPDNETITNDVNRGLVAFGIINQYYWYRLRAEIGVSNVHSKIAYFAPHDPGYVIDVSGAGVLSPQSTRRPRRSSLRSWYRERVKRSSPTRSATSTRSPRASPRPSPKSPSMTSSPIPSTLHSWGPVSAR